MLIRRFVLAVVVGLGIGLVNGVRAEEKAGQEAASKAKKAQKAPAAAKQGAQAKQGAPARTGAQAKQDTAANKAVFAEVKDDPNLPRVLVIGDSISIGYTLAVREALKGKVNLHRISENGGPTSKGVKNLKKWLGEKKWNVIVFNFGLHDLKTMSQTKAAQVSKTDYEKNLKEIITKLKATGAALIWATTTPVQDARTPATAKRQDADVVAYNAIAEKVMKAEGVTILDLYAAAKGANLEKIQKPDGVHFTDEGSKMLAEKVAAAITEALKKK